MILSQAHRPKSRSKNNNQQITKIFLKSSLMHYLFSNMLVILTSNMHTILIIIAMLIIHTISILNTEYHSRMYNNTPNTNRHSLIIICYSLTSNSLMEPHNPWLLLRIIVINKTRQSRKRRINKRMKLQSSSNSINKHSHPWNNNSPHNTITLTIHIRNSSRRLGRFIQHSLLQQRLHLSLR